MPRQRILTSHVGSLVRPPEFTDVLRRRHQGQEIAEFPEVLACAVEEVVRRQVEVGIDIGARLATRELWGAAATA
jgi:methionine synthase II (cobalamin-independent)